MAKELSLALELVSTLRSMGVPEFLPGTTTVSVKNLDLPNDPAINAALIEILKAELNLQFEDDDNYIAIHAWRILSQRKIDEAIPFLVELLVHADQDDDWSLSELPAIIASFGQKAVKPLAYSLRNEMPFAEDTWGFVGLLDSLEMIGGQTDLARASVCKELREVLDTCDQFSPIVIAFVISSLVGLKDKQSVPSIIMAFRRELVDESIISWDLVQSDFATDQPKSLPSLVEDAPQPNYRGEQWTERSLCILGSGFNTETLKFFLLGSILRVKFVSPSNQLKAVMFNLEGKRLEFESDGQAHLFIQNFMGLWNVMTEFQEKVFELPILEAVASSNKVSGAKWKAMVSSVKHSFWMGSFLTGLGFDSKSDAAFLDDEARVLVDHIFDFLAASRDNLKKSKAIDKLKPITELRACWTRNYLSLARSVRLAKEMDFKRVKLVEENKRHVGRNDPCPCGSQKKFKKCCLN